MTYKRPYKYSAMELLKCEIADLEIDLACAKRDGLNEYAKEVQQELLQLLARHPKDSDAISTLNTER